MTTTKKSSGFGGGLWIILVLLFGGALTFLIISIVALRSGGTRQLPDGSWVDAKITIWDTGYIWFSIGCFVIGLIAVYIMRRER